MGIAIGAYFVVAMHRHYKVAGDDLRALVNQLIERMLSIGASFTPDHRTCFVVNTFTFAVYELTIAFHIRLLQISGKARHALIIGQYGRGIDVEEIVIPDA